MILSYPKKIIPGHKLFFILKRLGIEHTDDISSVGKNTIAVLHQDYKNENTVSNEVLKLGLPIINQRCLNVKKDRVDQVFSSVFKYSSFINPIVHRGTCVIKSTQQAIHNGKFLQCPIDAVDEKTYWSGTGVAQRRIYQKLIDTRFELDRLREFRVPVIGGEIPILFVKELGIKSTFHPHKENYFHVYTDKMENWFDLGEINRIKDFALLMGVDFGEIDVLRDNSTGLIYCVDVNNIPMGTLFSHLLDKDEVIDLLAETFKRNIIDKL